MQARVRLAIICVGSVAAIACVEDAGPGTLADLESRELRVNLRHDNVVARLRYDSGDGCYDIGEDVTATLAGSEMSLSSGGRRGSGRGGPLCKHPTWRMEQPEGSPPFELRLTDSSGTLVFRVSESGRAEERSWKPRR